MQTFVQALRRVVWNPYMVPTAQETIMTKAIWNGKIIAESSATEVVEGNHYFPRDALHSDYFKASNRTSVCGWKGTASYLNIEVDGKVNNDAAWLYEAPKEEAKNITGYVAFWKGVEVID